MSIWGNGGGGVGGGENKWKGEWRTRGTGSCGAPYNKQFSDIYDTEYANIYGPELWS